MRKRNHFFEFEDLKWFPSLFRNFITDLLTFQINKFNIYGPVIEKIIKAAQRSENKKIIDLCSGGGGAIIRLHKEMNDKGLIPPFTIVITDKYPNISAFEKVASNGIKPIKESIDATNVPSDLKGFRTLFTAFHHFKPETARLILKDAVDKETAIGIVEITEREWKSLLTLIIAPIAALAFTPFVRPFKWSRLFWTYVIPLIPILYTWDGIISNLRSYKLEELNQMTKSLHANNYHFEMGNIVSKFHINLTYLIGHPCKEG